LLLDLIGAAEEPPTLTELAQRLNLPKSTVHGICGTLEELGLLMRLPNGGMALGPHVLHWANRFLSQINIVEAFNVMVSQRRDISDFTVTLAILDKGEALYLACKSSGLPLGITFRVGMRLPAPFSATGKANLISCSNEQLRQLYGDAWPNPLTAHSLHSLSELIEDLTLSRRKGFTTDRGQVVEGLTCFGAPVTDHRGAVVAGLSLSMPSGAAETYPNDTLGSKIAEMARELSLHIGAQSASHPVTPKKRVPRLRHSQ
jgi:DNA-binding IclR family transcriptional regulator